MHTHYNRTCHLIKNSYINIWLVQVIRHLFLVNKISDSSIVDEN